MIGQTTRSTVDFYKDLVAHLEASSQDLVVTEDTNFNELHRRVHEAQTHGRPEDYGVEHNQYAKAIAEKIDSGNYQELQAIFEFITNCINLKDSINEMDTSAPQATEQIVSNEELKEETLSLIDTMLNFITTLFRLALEQSTTKPDLESIIDDTEPNKKRLVRAINTNYI